MSGSSLERGDITTEEVFFMQVEYNLQNFGILIETVKDIFPL